MIVASSWPIVITSRRSGLVVSMPANAIVVFENDWPCHINSAASIVACIAVVRIQ